MSVLITGRPMSREEQIQAWRRANGRMKWSIPERHFNATGPPPELGDVDRAGEYSLVVLFYGFGPDDRADADAVLSGKLAWELTEQKRKKNIWQCESLAFSKDRMRLRPDAPRRPKGFYWRKIHLGARFQTFSAAEFRSSCKGETALGPEGFQLLAVTHPHLIDGLGSSDLPFMSLADYDVAPYGFGDFFDVPHLFTSRGVLGLGLGHVDRNYPAFGIPTLFLDAAEE